jgi:hypothetical protein
MISNARHTRLAPRAAFVPLALVLVLSACSSTFDALPEKMGGLPDSAPRRSAEPLPFPNVYQVRPTREAKPLDDTEQKKLESELTTLREQQKQLATSPPPEPPPPPPPPRPAAKKAAPTKTTAPAKKKQNDVIVPEQKGPTAPPKMVN